MYTANSQTPRTNVLFLTFYFCIFHLYFHVLPGMWYFLIVYQRIQHVYQSVLTFRILKFNFEPLYFLLEPFLGRQTETTMSRKWAATSHQRIILRTSTSNSKSKCPNQLRTQTSSGTWDFRTILDFLKCETSVFLLLSR